MTLAVVAIGAFTLPGCVPTSDPPAVCVPELSVSPENPKPGRIVTVATTNPCPAPEGTEWVVRIQPDGERIPLAQARVETVSGRVGTFTASRLARQAARKLRVFTAGEYWSVDLRERHAARVAWGGGELQEARVPVPEQDALSAEIAAFLAAVRGEAPYAVTGRDGLRALELALRIQAAIRA